MHYRHRRAVFQAEPSPEFREEACDPPECPWLSKEDGYLVQCQVS